VETSRPESRGIKSELKCEKTLEYDLAKSNQKHGERAGSYLRDQVAMCDKFVFAHEQTDVNVNVNKRILFNNRQQSAGRLAHQLNKGARQWISDNDHDMSQSATSPI
jgi:hypothetical protein